MCGWYRCIPVVYTRVVYTGMVHEQVLWTNNILWAIYFCDVRGLRQSQTFFTANVFRKYNEAYNSIQRIDFSKLRHYEIFYKGKIMKINRHKNILVYSILLKLYPICDCLCHSCQCKHFELCHPCTEGYTCKYNAFIAHVDH